MYLRGTYNKYVSKRPVYVAPTLANKVRRLERKVQGNTPSKFSYNSSENYSATAGWNRETFSFTDDFIDSGTFRDHATGDVWVNHTLNFILKFTATARIARVVIYFPDDPSAVFEPAASSIGFTEQPQLNRHRILLDTVINNPNDSGGTGQPFARRYSVPLGKRQTVWDHATDTISKGNLKALVIYDDTSTGGFIMGWALHMSDK